MIAPTAESQVCDAAVASQLPAFGHDCRASSEQQLPKPQEKLQPQLQPQLQLQVQQKRRRWRRQQLNPETQPPQLPLPPQSQPEERVEQKDQQQSQVKPQRRQPQLKRQRQERQQQQPRQLLRPRRQKEDGDERQRGQPLQWLLLHREQQEEGRQQKGHGGQQRRRRLVLSPPSQRRQAYEASESPTSGKVSAQKVASGQPLQPTPCSSASTSSASSRPQSQAKARCAAPAPVAAGSHGCNLYDVLGLQRGAEQWQIGFKVRALRKASQRQASRAQFYNGVDLVEQCRRVVAVKVLSDKKLRTAYDEELDRSGCSEGYASLGACTEDRCNDALKVARRRARELHSKLLYVNESHWPSWCECMELDHLIALQSWLQELCAKEDLQAAGKPPFWRNLATKPGLRCVSIRDPRGDGQYFVEVAWDRLYMQTHRTTSLARASNWCIALQMVMEEAGSRPLREKDLARLWEVAPDVTLKLGSSALCCSKGRPGFTLMSTPAVSEYAIWMVNTIHRWLQRAIAGSDDCAWFMWRRDQRVLVALQKKLDALHPRLLESVNGELQRRHCGAPAERVQPDGGLECAPIPPAALSSTSQSTEVAETATAVEAAANSWAQRLAGTTTRGSKRQLAEDGDIDADEVRQPKKLAKRSRKRPCAAQDGNVQQKARFEEAVKEGMTTTPTRDGNVQQKARVEQAVEEGMTSTRTQDGNVPQKAHVEQAVEESIETTQEGSAENGKVQQKGRVEEAVDDEVMTTPLQDPCEEAALELLDALRITCRSARKVANCARALPRGELRHRLSALAMARPTGMKRRRLARVMHTKAETWFMVGGKDGGADLGRRILTLSFLHAADVHRCRAVSTQARAAVQSEYHDRYEDFVYTPATELTRTGRAVKASGRATSQSQVRRLELLFSAKELRPIFVRLDLSQVLTEALKQLSLQRLFHRMPRLTELVVPLSAWACPSERRSFVSSLPARVVCKGIDRQECVQSRETEKTRAAAMRKELAEIDAPAAKPPVVAAAKPKKPVLESIESAKMYLPSSGCSLWLEWQDARIRVSWTSPLGKRTFGLPVIPPGGEQVAIRGCVKWVWEQRLLAGMSGPPFSLEEL